MKKKLRNYGLWMAIISCVIMIIQALGLRVDVPVLKEALIGICGILVVLGILSNPSNGKGFTDIEETEENKMQE